MAYFSGLVRSTLSTVGLGGAHANFPYTVGEPLEHQESDSLWTLHKGTKKEDQSEVTVFVYKTTQRSDHLPLTKNAYKRFRTMRHPHMLTYLDGIECPEYIYIVTQSVIPLSAYLRENRHDQLISWGLYTIAQAVKFLNVDCKLVHGNLRSSSVYVTPAGEWRLGGFETLCNPSEPDAVIKTYHGLLPSIQQYCPPEIQSQNWSSLENGSLDGWQFATLIYESFQGKLNTAADLSHTDTIPSTMLRAYKQLLAPAPNSRMTVAQFMAAGTQPRSFFDNEFIRTNLFLENLSVKDVKEKNEFFRQLGGHVEKFPVSFSTHKVLPELLKSLEFGAGGPQVLQAVVKIGNLLDDENYGKYITPTIVKLFSLPDRALRYCLLENIASFLPHISDKVVNNSIYSHVAAGFVDTAPAIREQTVKSFLTIVPRLNESTVQRDAVAALSKTLYDPEPGIRTNTLICFGKLGRYMTPSTHQTMVGPLFARSLRDPFVHARAAALMAISATAEWQLPKDVANRILPAVCTLLLDPEKPVRTQALKTATELLKVVEEEAQTMPESAQPKTATSGAVGGGPGGQSPNSTEGALQEGWSGWAVSSLSRGL
ncbi:armadillo-type protein, partial [Dimargaris cristalligena]